MGAPLRPQVSQSRLSLQGQIVVPAEHQDWSPSVPQSGPQSYHALTCPGSPSQKLRAVGGWERLASFPRAPAYGLGTPPSPCTGTRLREAQTAAARGGVEEKAKGGRPPREDLFQLQGRSSSLLASHRGVLSPALPWGIPRDLRVGREGRISCLPLEIFLGCWATLDGRRLVALNLNLREEMWFLLWDRRDRLPIFL